MERNTVVMIDQLRHGDVFYRLVDKKKTVWVLLVHPIKSRKGVNDERVMIDRDTYEMITNGHLEMREYYLKRITQNYQVVFLRHTCESDLSTAKLPNE